MAAMKVKYVDGAKPVRRIEGGDWIDLRARETVEMEKGDFKLIPLGICTELPFMCEAYVVPRSSTFKKWGIVSANSIGIIDNSYRGEWMFPALALRDTTVYAGDRICQFRIHGNQEDFQIVEVKELGESSRGDSGFGSTGTN